MLFVPLAAAEPDWADVYARSSGTFRAGSTTMTVGLSADVVGSVLGIPPVAVVGGLLEHTGPALMAGGSLRATRAVNEAGGDVSTAAGTIAWVAWGGELAVGVADTVGTGGYRTLPGIASQLVLLTTSAIASSVQMGAARRQWSGSRPDIEEEWDDLPDARAPSSRPPVLAVAAPFLVDGGGGVAAAVVW